MHSPFINWNATVDPLKPVPPQHDHFAAWFVQQDPMACSEKDRVRMTNHFLEHLLHKNRVCWPGQPATAQAILGQDPRIQAVINQWVRSWQWSEPAKFYEDMLSASFRHPRVQDYFIESVKASPDALFGVQLLMVLANEYFRSILVQEQYHAFLVRTGYHPTWNNDAPDGAFLHDYLVHWEKSQNENKLSACQGVFEMLHPRPPASLVDPGAEETRNAMFRSFIQMRRNGQSAHVTLPLPSDMLDQPT